MHIFFLSIPLLTIFCASTIMHAMRHVPHNTEIRQEIMGTLQRSQKRQLAVAIKQYRKAHDCYRQAREQEHLFKSRAQHDGLRKKLNCSKKILIDIEQRLRRCGIDVEAIPRMSTVAKNPVLFAQLTDPGRLTHYTHHDHTPHSTQERPSKRVRFAQDSAAERFVALVLESGLEGAVKNALAWYKQSALDPCWHNPAVLKMSNIMRCLSANPSSHAFAEMSPLELLKNPVVQARLSTITF